MSDSRCDNLTQGNVFQGNVFQGNVFQGNKGERKYPGANACIWVEVMHVADMKTV